MATLHSGLLVDPTNSKQIADACLKILTNSELWHEMSDNGESLSLRTSSQLHLLLRWRRLVVESPDYWNHSQLGTW